MQRYDVAHWQSVTLVTATEFSCQKKRWGQKRSTPLAGCALIDDCFLQQKDRVLVVIQQQCVDRFGCRFDLFRCFLHGDQKGRKCLLHYGLAH